MRPLTILALAFVSVQFAVGTELHLTPFVNPFIGTDPNPFTHDGYAMDTGNVFPGAVCPRGMVAWSPDTTHQEQIAGGYWYPDRVIEDFSLTHFSGRGIPCLKDIRFMPTIQAIGGSTNLDWKIFAATFSHANENASPGYYRVKLDNGIETELTATPRTGMARFTFPAKSNAALLIRADSSISIHGNEITGFHVNKIGGGKQTYTIYFAAQFDRPFQTAKTWHGNSISDELSAQDKKCGAILSFDVTTNSIVQVRVGISYVSIENARANLTAENPAGNFSAICQKADTDWNAVLNRIQVEGGTLAQKRAFYTALYHCFIHPNLLDDANGQYPGMDEKIYSVEAGRHQYQNITAWDQHRSLMPLLAILSPKESSDICQSLVNYARQDASVRTNGGGLPRWEQINRNSGGMVGDGDDAIIAAAFALGATNFDAQAALIAMDKGASQPGTTSDGMKVRDGLENYSKLGYVPHEASVTLEYCNDDFALARFAKALGDDEKFRTYQNRAQNWKNLFDDSTGYIHPRKANGAWTEKFSAKAISGFVEGTASQYTWMVNFNLRGLIDKMGGDKKTIACLDHFFSQLNSGLYGDTQYTGNEPCEETPWIYDFAGIPSRTQKVVRRIQNELFTDKPSGLPGNDDAGALSSWFIFSALGFYPEIPGVAGFAVGSPLFPKATIHLENGATIQIIGKNAATKNPYIQNLKLNHQKIQTPWISWNDLVNGATLVFNLGDKASHWGENQVLPSFDSVQ